VANLVHLRLFLCDWGSWARRHARLETLLRDQLARHGANKTVSCQPFHALLYPPFPPDLALDVARYDPRVIYRTINTSHSTCKIRYSGALKGYFPLCMKM
jgi:hypothetical protein